MTTLLSKSIYCSRFVRVVLLGLVAICGAANPLLGQDTVGGKFTLTENTRFGKKFLPAGAYTFSIEPTGALQSVESIQRDRKSTRLNSSHQIISYAVFCLKKKNLATLYCAAHHI